MRTSLHSLIALGLSVLHLAPHAHHYWWPGMENCTLSSSTGGSIFPAHCTGVPAHWGTTPPPRMAGPTMAQVTQAAQNYCPLKPGGWCHPPN